MKTVSYRFLNSGCEGYPRAKLTKPPKSFKNGIQAIANATNENGVDTFPDVSSVSNERIQPDDIRTEKRRAIDAQSREVIAWLAEAFLHAHPNGSVALRTVLDSTSLFPFRLSPISADHLVAVSGRLDVLRHGLDQDTIMLRDESRQKVRKAYQW